MYSLIYNSTTILRDLDGAFIPPDSMNTDYINYLAWVAKGNTPNPAIVPPPATPSCLLWQLQASLTTTQWSTITTEIAAMNNPVISAFLSHGTNVIPANSTTLISLANSIGITPTQLNTLVTSASLLSIP